MLSRTQNDLQQGSRVLTDPYGYHNDFTGFTDILKEVNEFGRLSLYFIVPATTCASGLRESSRLV